MKIRHATWFWFGIVFAFTAGDGMSNLVQPRTRFPDPLAAIPLWMLLALIPAGVFYVAGRISCGMFPQREIRTNHLILFTAGAVYPSLSVIFSGLSDPYGKVSGMLILYLSPLFTWRLLRKKIRIR